MEFIEKCMNPYWKTCDDATKRRLFREILTEFVDDELEVTDVEMRTFELFGLKTTTFECLLSGERFIFIPGARDVVLGWDAGCTGLPITEIFRKGNQNEGHDFRYNKKLTKDEKNFVSNLNEERPVYNMTTISGVDDFINEHTTNVRRVTIPPMLVARYAVPASCNYLGELNPVTGEFVGDLKLYLPMEEEIKNIIFPPLDDLSAIDAGQPDKYLEPGKFYLEFISLVDRYAVYKHQDMTLRENRKRIQAWHFDLLNEDQWEYVCGGGTRRLFRWGNEIDLEEIRFREISQSARKRAELENMFGLIFDISRTRFEVTKDEEVLKLGITGLEDDLLIEQVLPLSSYYQSYARVGEEEVLSPLQYSYRKALIITADNRKR